MEFRHWPMLLLKICHSLIGELQLVFRSFIPGSVFKDMPKSVCYTTDEESAVPLLPVFFCSLG